MTQIPKADSRQSVQSAIEVSAGARRIRGDGASCRAPLAKLRMATQSFIRRAPPPPVGWDPHGSSARRGRAFFLLWRRASISQTRRHRDCSTYAGRDSRNVPRRRPASIATRQEPEHETFIGPPDDAGSPPTLAISKGSVRRVRRARARGTPRGVRGGSDDSRQSVSREDPQHARQATDQHQGARVGEQRTRSSAIPSRTAQPHGHRERRHRDHRDVRSTGRHERGDAEAVLDGNAVQGFKYKDARGRERARQERASVKLGHGVFQIKVDVDGRLGFVASCRRIRAHRLHALSLSRAAIRTACGSPAARSRTPARRSSRSRIRPVRGSCIVVAAGRRWRRRPSSTRRPAALGGRRHRLGASRRCRAWSIGTTTARSTSWCSPATATSGATWRRQRHVLGRFPGGDESAGRLGADIRVGTGYTGGAFVDLDGDGGAISWSRATDGTITALHATSAAAARRPWTPALVNCRVPTATSCCRAVPAAASTSPTGTATACWTSSPETSTARSVLSQHGNATAPAFASRGRRSRWRDARSRAVQHAPACVRSERRRRARPRVRRQLALLPALPQRAAAVERPGLTLPRRRCQR